MGVPDTIASIADLRVRARRRVPRPFFDYVESGSFQELTLHRNRADLDALEFRQRVMSDVSALDLTTTMLGEPVAMPVALGPVGLCGAVWSNGEILSCRAAQRFGIPFSLSTNAVLSIEDVAASVERPFWFQLYLTRDRGFSEELIGRAESAGCSALILTMDLHVEGTRYRDVHNGLGIPPKLTFANIWSVATRPRWALHMLGSKRWSFGNYAGRTDPANLRQMARLVSEQLDPSFDRASLEWVRRRWTGKLIVKGILDAQDARIAVECGADAILVSNHGGRQLDGAASTAAILPEIVRAVGSRTEIFVDGGVRSGLDVLRFLGLGARACFIGRAYLYGLGAYGEPGVAKALELIKTELSVAMALTGVTRASSVPASVLRTKRGAPQLSPHALEAAR